MRITRLDKGFKLSGTRREAIALMLIPLLFPPIYIGSMAILIPSDVVNSIFFSLYTVLGYLIGIYVLGLLIAIEE